MAYSHEFIITDGANISVIPEVHSGISSMRKHVEELSVTDGSVYGNYEILAQTLGMAYLALKIEKKADRLPAVNEDSILLKFLYPRMIGDLSRLIAIMPHYVNQREIPVARGYRVFLHHFIAELSTGSSPLPSFTKDTSQKIIDACEENISQTLERFGLDSDAAVTGSKLKYLWSSRSEFALPHINHTVATDIALTGALARHLSETTGGIMKNESLFASLPGISQTVDPEGYFWAGKFLSSTNSPLAKYFPKVWTSN